MEDMPNFKELMRRRIIEELNMHNAMKSIPMGLTLDSWQEFTDLLPQANDLQLEHMQKLIKQEIYRRNK